MSLIVNSHKSNRFNMKLNKSSTKNTNNINKENIFIQIFLLSPDSLLPENLIVKKPSNNGVNGFNGMKSTDLIKFPLMKKFKKIHESGKYRFCGNNINGCPILVIRMRYHVKGLATADENLRYLLYMIEKGY